MAFDPFSSTSSSKQTITGVSDQGQLVSGKGAKIAQGNGILTDNVNGAFASPGSNAIRGNVSLTNGSSLVLNSADPEILGAALDELHASGQLQSANYADLISQLSQVSASSQNSNTSLIDSVLGKISDLAENKQTDGESGRNKIILYIVLAIAGAVALIFYGKGK